ncbi:MAG: hypothetical protein ACR2P2_01080 [Nakamurella sp.]
MLVHHRPSALLAAAGIVAGTVLLAPVAAASQQAVTNSSHHHHTSTLVPIGGGYEADTEQQFAQVVARSASGATVDLLVIPSSYGDDPADRQTNLEQAQLRTDELDANCEAAIDHTKFAGCTATLLTLLDRDDALNAANSAALDNPGIDGAFVLGGDQDIAMHVLANTPAEAALTRAYHRGVIVSGTSAGNAVESRTMITGYTADGYPETGLQKDSVTIGWGDTLNTEDRGLAFGSQRFIFDQHFYQRGRFGRLLNITAQSVDRYGHGGKLGLGTDYATAAIVADDKKITGMIGESSATVFNFDSATKPRWEGPDATLSERNVLTHLIAPGTGMTYDAVHRQLLQNGHPVPVPRPRALPQPFALGRATLILGGGDNGHAASAVLTSFVRAAKGSRIVVIATGYSDTAAAQAAGNAYSAALTAAGWPGSVTVLVHGRDAVNPATVNGAAGVVFVGGDQRKIGAAVSDRNFAATVRWAVLTGHAVLTDGAMTAVMADRYDAVASPTSDNYEDEGVRYFRTDAQRIQRGLGIVKNVTLEPWLTYNYRWGLLFGAAKADNKTVALGISEQTSLLLHGNTSSVVGARSVVSVDGRQGRFSTGSNGAIAAKNTYISTFAAGDQLH